MTHASFCSNLHTCNPIPSYMNNLIHTHAHRKSKKF